MNGNILVHARQNTPSTEMLAALLSFRVEDQTLRSLPLERSKKPHCVCHSQVAPEDKGRVFHAPKGRTPSQDPLSATKGVPGRKDSDSVPVKFGRRGHGYKQTLTKSLPVPHTGKGKRTR